MYTRNTSKDKQKGAVLALFAVALVVIIGMAGLVLDVSHAFIDKTRLQNAVDAASLSGAFTLMTTQDEFDAEADALATFRADLESEFDPTVVVPVVYFSDSLSTWSGQAASLTTGSTKRFVQVSLLDNQAHQMTTWLTRIFNHEVIPVGVSATAGPIAASPCKLDPFIVCGDPNLPCTDPDDTCYGFDRWKPSDTNPPEECYLKGCSNANCNTNNTVQGGCGVQGGGAVGGINGDIGPGNFYTARLGCNGANCFRDAFKDTAEHNCADLGGMVPTEPGNMVGPVKQAYNTKFNDYQGPVNPNEWPPDKVISETFGGDTMFYDDYGTAPQDNFGATAVANKRVMNIIVADCAGKNGGASNDLPVLTIACFFGTKKIASDAGGNEIVVWGQFVSGQACGGDAITLDNTIDNYKIILYKDPDTGDS